ncbi:MAG: tyrosine-type recombinase/integrase [Kiloniellales bacterium]
MKLTKAAISGLTLDDGKKDAIFWDSDLPGFGVRIRSGGKKTFIVQYRVGRQQRRLTLGRIDALDLSEARRKARGALGKAGLGEDTQAAKAVARQVQAPFFRDLVKRFLERQQSRLRPKSYSETKRYLEQSWRSLHAERVDQVTRAIIAGRLTDMAKANGPVAADRARAAISAMFAWAMREGLAESNPAAMTNRHSDANPGERTLSDAELALIWRACNEDDYGRIVRLLMLTGSRREEVAAMEWRELDLDNKLWVLPAARAKNHLGHEVPLSDGALAILGEVPRRDDRQLLFGMGEGPFSGWSQAKKRMDKRIAAVCKEKGVAVPPHWTLHDLRRTVATRMAELGIAQPHIVEAVLNHISGHKAGVAGIYNRATYRDEKRRALEAWGAHVKTVARHEGDKE